MINLFDFSLWRIIDFGFYLLLIRVFHISVSWWSFTGDWVTASLLKFPGLFSVFWPFSIMLLFGWSPLGRQLLNLPGSLFTVPKAPITIGIIVTFMFYSSFQFSSKVKVFISLFKFYQFYSVVCHDSKVDNFANSLFFCWLLLLLLSLLLFYSLRVFHSNFNSSGWLVGWFFVISTLVGNLMSNPVYIYIYIYYL